MIESNKLPESPNITPIKSPKKRGNPNLGKGNRGKNTGPRKNTKAQITFKGGTYYLPDNITIGVENVTIRRDEILEMALEDAEWETIENIYQVSQSDIKKYYEGVYNRGKAIYALEGLKQLNAEKKAGNADIMKWMDKARQKKLGKNENESDGSGKLKLSVPELETKVESLLRKLGSK